MNGTDRQATEWEDRLVDRLREAGFEEAEAIGMAQDALADAAAAGTDPTTLYGPSVVYADALARAARGGAATAAPRRREPGEVVLRLRGVGKRYRRRRALRAVDLDLRGGEVAAVVGANGSGKSTLLNICAGLTAPSTGTVERAARLGYAPQQHGVVPYLTPDEHFRLFGAAAGMAPSAAVGVGRTLAGNLGWQPRRRTLAAQLSGGTQ